jgi:hypothetical protein
MSKQTTSSVLMIRPVAFTFNKETASSNAFQYHASNFTEKEIQQKALFEFENFVENLTAAGVEVVAVDDTSKPHTPDSIAPNNWITTHHDGTVVLYPMQAENRRLERRKDILDILQKKFKFTIKEVVDLSSYEKKGKYLEGTGSIVFDHPNKLAYANISPRTSEVVLKDLCQKIKYDYFIFHASDEKGVPIYHTNVMMSLGEKVAIVCLESLKETSQRNELEKRLKKSGREILNLNFQQIAFFTANMLQLHNHKKEAVFAMSHQGYCGFTQEQAGILAKYGKVVSSPMPAFERIGGGSARCMLAEIFLPKKK